MSYDNRLNSRKINCKPCSASRTNTPSSTRPVNPVLVKPEVIVKECPKPEILKIIACGDMLNILFKDGTYTTAELDVVCPSVCEALGRATNMDLSSIEKRVSDLEAKEDKDTIFDPSALESRLDALNNKLESLPTEEIQDWSGNTTLTSITQGE